MSAISSLPTFYSTPELTGGDRHFQSYSPRLSFPKLDEDLENFLNSYLRNDADTQVPTLFRDETDENKALDNMLNQEMPVFMRGRSRSDSRLMDISELLFLSPPDSNDGFPIHCDSREDHTFNNPFISCNAQNESHSSGDAVQIALDMPFKSLSPDSVLHASLGPGQPICQPCVSSVSLNASACSEDGNACPNLNMELVREALTGDDPDRRRFVEQLLNLRPQPLPPEPAPSGGAQFEPPVHQTGPDHGPRFSVTMEDALGLIDDNFFFEGAATPPRLSFFDLTAQTSSSTLPDHHQPQLPQSFHPAPLRRASTAPTSFMDDIFHDLGLDTWLSSSNQGSDHARLVESPCPSLPPFSQQPADFNGPEHATLLPSRGCRPRRPLTPINTHSNPSRFFGSALDEFNSPDSQGYVGFQIPLDYQDEVQQGVGPNRSMTTMMASLQVSSCENQLHGNHAAHASHSSPAMNREAYSSIGGPACPPHLLHRQLSLQEACSRFTIEQHTTKGERHPRGTNLTSPRGAGARSPCNPNRRQVQDSYLRQALAALRVNTGVSKPTSPRRISRPASVPNLLGMDDLALPGSPRSPRSGPPSRLGSESGTPRPVPNMPAAVRGYESGSAGQISTVLGYSLPAVAPISSPCLNAGVQGGGIEGLNAGVQGGGIEGFMPMRGPSICMTSEDPTTELLRAILPDVLDINTPDQASDWLPWQPVEDGYVGTGGADTAGIEPLSNAGSDDDAPKSPLNLFETFDQASPGPPTLNWDPLGGLSGGIVGTFPGSLTGGLTGAPSRGLSGNLTGPPNGVLCGGPTGAPGGGLTGGLIRAPSGDLSGGLGGASNGVLSGGLNGTSTRGLSEGPTRAPSGGLNGGLSGASTGVLSGGPTSAPSGGLSGGLGASPNGVLSGGLSGASSGGLIGGLSGAPTKGLSGDLTRAPTGGLSEGLSPPTARAARTKSADNKPELEAKVLTIRPHGSGEKRVITKVSLREVYHLPISDAADALGIGVTVLKRLCRQFKIARWPYRKLKSMDKLIGSVSGCGLVREDMELVIKDLEMFRASIYDDPGVDMEEPIKKLRQANFKLEYKQRQIEQMQFFQGHKMGDAPFTPPLDNAALAGAPGALEGGLESEIPLALFGQQALGDDSDDC